MNSGDTPQSRMEGFATVVTMEELVAAEGTPIVWTLETPAARAVMVGQTGVGMEEAELDEEMEEDTNNVKLNYIKDTLTKVIITLIPLFILLAIYVCDISFEKVAFFFTFYQQIFDNIKKVEEFIKNLVSYIIDKLCGINVHNNNLRLERSSFRV